MSVKIFHFTRINFYFLKDEQCCDFATLSKMKHKVLCVISHIFYMRYLQELKSRYSGIPLLMINTLGLCQILHWYLRAQHVKKRRELNHNYLIYLTWDN